MFTKSVLTLAALLLAGVTTAAFADEVQENKIGDRYPFLEQQYQPTSAKAARSVPAPKTMKLDHYMNEDVENKIGDRYPFLEQPIRVANAGPKSAARTTRLVMPFTYAEKAEFNLQSTRAVF